MQHCAIQPRFMRAWLIAALAIGLGGLLGMPGQPPAALAAADSCGPASVTADLPARDGLSQSSVPASRWYEHVTNGSWGPRPAALPAVEAPPGCNAVAWKRARVVAVAQHYLGLPYRHHHIPGWAPSADLVGAGGAGAGLDCSNFTAWVYNYGLGVQIPTDVQQQANGPQAPGRVLAPGEPFAPGDLLYIWNNSRSEVSHVVIYVDEHTVIDSHEPFGGVTAHPREGWFQSHYSHARRIIE